MGAGTEAGTPTLKELQRLQDVITLMRTTFGAYPPSMWPLDYMVALSTQVHLAMEAPASSQDDERHGMKPAFVVRTDGLPGADAFSEPQAPVETYQDRHAIEEAARLQREIGPILAELKAAVTHAPPQTKIEGAGYDYAHVLSALVEGMAVVGKPVEAARLL